MRLAPLRQRSEGLIARNVVCRGVRTSIRLEQSMWDALNDVVAREGTDRDTLTTIILAFKSPALSLTAAVRVFLLEYYRAAATEPGHRQAGHGRTAIARLAKLVLAGASAPQQAGALQRQDARADRLDHRR